ncbi:MAG: tetratricopeptide repeat protein [Acidobacteria bacterium]|nr:tetratricopeptide repeat protein [Acidobacteriota bacterium]
MSDRIAVFKQMLESDPENPMVLFGLANEYLKAGKNTEAIDRLEEYLKFETDEGAAYGMLANAYESLGEKEKARSAYEKGIEVSLANGHPSMASDYKMTLEMDYSD